MSVLNQIVFRPELTGCLGLEQEFFLMDAGHVEPHDPWGMGHLVRATTPVPRSPAFLGQITDPRWTYELSACQVECRTNPYSSVSDVMADLRENHVIGMAAADAINCVLACDEVAPWWMPLDVYPHDARYAQIARVLSRQKLRAACRVAGIHVHYGCRDIYHALRVHAVLTTHLDVLKKIGDHSRGKRLALYAGMAPQHQPPVYESIEHFSQVAEAQGFAENMRNCWHLVRISRHGTVEVRCFGNTNNLDEISSFVSIVSALAGTVA